ncbi:MAG: RNA-binding protein [Bacteroidetes bacterium]|nr:RNA-binding protein [Bacteroidota bacterium]
MNIYIGNLNWTATNEEISDLFSSYGEVTSVKIVTDKFTQRSKGFGFVEMSSGGQEAIDGLNEKDFKGRPIVVNEAQPREERPRDGGNRGGGDFNRRRF